MQKVLGQACSISQVLWASDPDGGNRNEQPRMETFGGEMGTRSRESPRAMFRWWLFHYLALFLISVALLYLHEE